MKMKVVYGLLFLLPCFGYGQKYDTVYVGINTTSHVIFNSPIVDPDLGSGTHLDESGKEVSDVLMQRVGNRLKLGASIENFEVTNLFVETETAYFNVIIVYAAKPKQLTYYLYDDKADKIKDPSSAGMKGAFPSIAKGTEIIKAKQDKILEMTIQDLAAEVFKKGNVVPDIGESTQRMKYFLNGIYVKGDYLFFRVNVINEGNVKYDLGYEGFFINDKKNKGTKKTPTQPEAMTPVYIYNDDVKTVDKKIEVSKVYVFKKFTLEPKKVFTIEFWEDGQGQRKVELNIPPDKLLSAKTI